VLEEVGYYDPMVPETDARAILKGERIDYWLGVGAQPSDKVAVLIKKYGANGTHLEAQKDALERLAGTRRRPTVPTDLPKMEKVVRKKKEKKEEEVVAPAPIEEVAAVETEAVVAPVEAEVAQTENTPAEPVQEEVAQAEAAPVEADKEST
jgi:small subunit ribosomal protein S16